MQVQHAAAAGAFVQVVDVLGDDADAVVFFQIRQCLMRGVRHGGGGGAAALVVKTDDGLRVAREGFGGADVFDAVSFPQAVAVAEGLQAALRADARAGEYGECFHVFSFWGFEAV